MEEFYPYQYYLRAINVFTLDLTTMWLSYGGDFDHAQLMDGQLPFLPIPVDRHFDETQYQELVALSTLYIIRCPLSELPTFVFATSFHFLTTVDIANCNGLTTLPPSLCKQATINTLNISRCHHLTILPDNLGDLCQLTTLNLDGNHRLQTLPDSLLKLPALQSLSLINNHRMTFLPDGTVLRICYIYININIYTYIDRY